MRQFLEESSYLILASAEVDLPHVSVLGRSYPYRHVLQVEVSDALGQLPDQVIHE